MKTFKSFVLEEMVILENRINELKERNPEIDSSHDVLATKRSAADIIDHFANADPTPKKNYTQWIVNRYKQKDFRQEDSTRIHTALSNFERYKARLDKKDIGQYKSLSDVEDAVEPHLGTVASNNEAKRQVKDEGAELIHQEPGLMVHKIKTKEAACLYGRGTKWCTAADNDNRFDHYNENGPLYVVQHTDSKGKLNKYQFHFETNQFADAQDKMVPLSTLTKRMPGLKNVSKFKEQHIAFNTPEEANARLRNNGFKDGADAIRVDNVGTPVLSGSTLKHYHDHVVHKLEHPDMVVAAANALADHRNTPPEVLESLHSNGKINSYGMGALFANPNLPKHIIDHTINSDTTSSFQIAKLAANPALTADHIRQIHRDWSTNPNSGRLVTTQIVAHKTTPSDVIGSILKTGDRTIKPNVVKHPNMSDQDLHSVIAGSDYALAVHALHNPSIQDHHLTAAAANPALKPYIAIIQKAKK